MQDLENLSVESTSEPTTPYAYAQPPALIGEILDAARIAPSSEAYALSKHGLVALMHEVLQSNEAKPRVDRSAIDQVIARIDKKLGDSVNAILHHADVKHLEAAWRGVKALVDRIDFGENIRLELLSAKKNELLEDFADAPEITRSGLYRRVYTEEYGVFGGQPYGAIIGAFDVGPNATDMQLLKQCAQVAAMAHAPLLTNASPSFFGETSFEALPQVKDLSGLLEGPQYARWHAFRDSEDSRYVGLCLPRFLLRLPYGPETHPTKTFHFEEQVADGHEQYLWGYASLALASRVADSFAKYRWAPHIVGPRSGGTVDALPLHTFKSMGVYENKIPTEILLSERREYELSEQGFIGLTFRKDSDNACFFSANSVQRPKTFGTSQDAKTLEHNARLATQLPYTFVVTRLAHYIKVLQREQLGSFTERIDLERELNVWLRQYIADMDDPSHGVRSRRPLRRAQVKVDSVMGQPGWYRCHIEVQPHLKYMGASFTLSLVGRLEK